jgi:phospholipase C
VQIKQALVVVTLLLLSACRGNGGLAGSSQVMPAADFRFGHAPSRDTGKGIDKIQHVVIIVQENRSFNNLFMGFPGAKTQTYGHDSKGEKVTLQPLPLTLTWDLEHNSAAYYAACNGTGKIPGTDCRMNGFDKETWKCDQPGYEKCPIKYPPYSYVKRSDIAPYWSLAQQYVLADEMYPSNFDDSSYVSHQYIIAAQAAQATNYPYTNWGCPGGPGDQVGRIKISPPRKNLSSVTDCFDYKSLADKLDGAGDSWAFYAGPLGSQGPHGKTCDAGGEDTKTGTYKETGIWSSFQTIKHICYGPDWNNVFSGPPRFLTDIGKGVLRDVTWITPYCRDSDHPGPCNVSGDEGPSWVASVVNAIGKSSFWNSTAIFLFWDDSGGFFDAEPPGYVDYDGFGIRVPLIIISPYAKKGYVTHVQFEHGSILKFVENRFGLTPLTNGGSDDRATSPEKCCFDFSKPPRKFVPIKSKLGIDYFLHEPVDPYPADNG